MAARTFGLGQVEVIEADQGLYFADVEEDRLRAVQAGELGQTEPPFEWMDPHQGERSTSLQYPEGLWVGVAAVDLQYALGQGGPQ